MTQQDLLTVAAAYHLRQRTDGKGPNISAICRDTGLGREVVAKAVADLTKNHADWLAEYGEMVMAEARKELVSDEFTRIRAKINRFAGRLIDKTEETFFKLHDACQKAALDGKVKEDSDEFQSLKIKQFERRASLGILKQAISMAQELESATSPKVSPVFNNTNLQIPPDEKKSRFLRLENLQPESRNGDHGA